MSMKSPAKAAAEQADALRIEEADPKKLARHIKKLLSKQPMNEGELAEASNVPIALVRTIVADLRGIGVNVRSLAHGKMFISSIIDPGGALTLQAEPRADGWTVFGIITDNHKGNRHHRQDVEDAAYKTFEREGVKTVLNAGNALDGEARFNKNELIAHGIDGQIDLWTETTPQVKNLTTHFITGRDHEGWWNERECINVGEYMQMKAEKAGRKDLHYLGHVEADVSLKCGNASAVLRVMHPGGGSSYAMSYAPQKIVEAYQGGEKPDVLIIGHYHKFDYCVPREVHVISAGCAEDQTIFMRTKKIAAHVGFVLVKLKQDSVDGHITRLCVEWNPFFDRGYYEKRY